MKKEPKEKFRGAGRVAFLARKDEIKQMIDAGYPLIWVFEKHGDELNMSYSQFIRYVHRYFRSEQSDKPTSKNVESKASGSDFDKVSNAELPEDQCEPDDPEKQFERDAEEGDFF